MDDALRRASDGVFRYPDTPPPRRHQTQGYCAYQSCKPWLRDEFRFRCVYCLWRECWEANGHHGFGVEHVNPRSTSEEQVVAGAGEAPTALKAAEQLAGRFDVPAANLKAETLLTTARQATLSGQQKAVAEAASKLLEELATAEEYETALALCEAARGCARTAKQSQLAKDLAARADELKKRASAFQEYRAALTALETIPTDAEANLAAGRYLCLVKRDWDRGVAMLALGNDPKLKAVATKELQGTNSAEEQVAVGDAWWSLADSQAGREQESLRLRAGA